MFDENGKSLFLTLLQSTKPKHPNPKRTIYSDIRNGIFSAEYSEEYSWILSCTCSNLNSLASHTEEEHQGLYPSEDMVRSVFWENILIKTDYDLGVLPGLSRLLGIIQQEKFLDLIKHSALQDILYIDSKVQCEFDETYKKHVTAYESDCKKTAKKWWEFIYMMAAHRKEERKQWVTENPMPSPDKLFALLAEIPSEPLFTAGKDLSHANSRKHEQDTYHKVLNDKIMELAPQSKSFNLSDGPYLLSSQELYQKIADSPQTN